MFDLDGTLHDRAAGIASFAEDQFNRRGKHLTQLKQYIDRFIELDANGKVWKDRVYLQLLREFELNDHPSVDELVTEYLLLFPKFSIPFEGVLQLLQQLKRRGLKIGIVTNGRVDLQNAVVTELGLKDLIDILIVSEGVGCRKPDREIFDLAIRSLKVNKELTIMVGDDEASDILGAANAGLRSIAFRCTDTSNATAMATSMLEVQAVVENLLGFNPL